MSDGLKVIYAARNSPEAHMLKNHLGEAGIRAIVTNDVLEGGVGVDIVGWPTLPRVAVAAEDAEAALVVRGEGGDLAGAAGVPDVDGGLVGLVRAGCAFLDDGALRAEEDLALDAGGERRLFLFVASDGHEC